MAITARKPRVPSGSKPERRKPAPVLNLEDMPDGNPALALQLMMTRSAATEYIDVVIEGQKLRFHYKPMLWMAKSRAVSKATEMQPVINEHTRQMELKSSIHFDVFFRECLKEMIVNPPFPLTDKTIDMFSQQVGDQFSEIMPDFFDTQERVEQAKKELGLSSVGEQT